MGPGLVSRLRLLLVLVVGAAPVLLAGGAASAAPTGAIPCRPGPASPADQAIAESLRPSMTGKRLGRAISGRHVACARVIVGQVRDRGLTPRAAVIAVTTAIAESTLHNHTIAVDHDSLGLFQQRPSQGWGRPQQLIDPRFATDAFLNALLRKFPGGSWMSGEIGAICQRVQTSAYPRAYSPEAGDAQLIVTRLWTAPRTVSSTPAPGRAPAGPFQKTVYTGGTELGPLTGRHHLAMADWNFDGRDDLVVVKGSETVTGKTEIRIMDGVTNFSALLLTTATMLGPTDNRHEYAMGDWNGDRRPDLIVVQQPGTPGGRAQLAVIDGASNFQQLLLNTATGLGATDERHEIAVADWNGDGKLDLVVTQTAKTTSRKMEVRVLDGASDFQRELTPAITTAEPAAGKARVTVTDWNGDRRPDLVVLPAAGGKTQLRVLDGASQLRRHLLRAGTAQAAVDDRHDLLIRDGNADGKPDLTVVQKSGTASGRPEVRTLGG